MIFFFHINDRKLCYIISNFIIFKILSFKYFILKIKCKKKNSVKNKKIITNFKSKSKIYNNNLFILLQNIF